MLGMLGLDISKHQDGIDLSNGNYDFCIVKLTEGNGYQDPKCREYISKLLDLNKNIGVYHFARPDLHPTEEGMQKEALYFCDVYKLLRLQNKAIAVLDWETEPMDNVDLLSTWLSTVEKELGILPFIYSGKSWMTKWKNANFMEKYPLWMAVWPDTKKYNVGTYPIPTAPSHPPLGAVDWKIWQYSSNGTFPGYKGRVDLDCTTISSADWIKYATKKDSEEKEVISEETQWAIDNGIIYGDGAGHYFLSWDATRDQVVTMLYRFYKNFIEDKDKE